MCYVKSYRAVPLTNAFATALRSRLVRRSEPSYRFPHAPFEVIAEASLPAATRTSSDSPVMDNGERLTSSKAETSNREACFAASPLLHLSESCSIFEPFISTIGQFPNCLSRITVASARWGFP